MSSGNAEIFSIKRKKKEEGEKNKKEEEITAPDSLSDSCKTCRASICEEAALVQRERDSCWLCCKLAVFMIT